MVGLDRQTGKETDDGKLIGWKGRRVDRWRIKDVWMDGQTDRWTDRQADGQT